MHTLEFKISPLHNPDVELCHNLRPDRDGTRLNTVGTPTTLLADPRLPGLTLLPGGRIHHENGREWLMMQHDRDLVAFDGWNLHLLPRVDATPRAIIRSGDHYLVLMGADHAPMLLQPTSSGVWTWRSTADHPEPLAILRKDESTLTAKVGGVNLRGAYTSRSATLTDDDRQTVSRLLADAYRTIALDAARRSVCFQPVVARYTLIGHDGATLYTSAPVMLSPDGGQQLMSVPFILTGSTFSSLSETTLTASTFSIRLRPTAPMTEGWGDAVAGVRLHVSPQLHPFDGSLRASVRFGTFTATVGSLTVCMPGISGYAVAPAAPGTRLHTLTEGILAHISEALTPVGFARFDATLGEWDGLDRTFTPLPGTPDEEIRTLEKIVTSAIPLPGGSEALLASVSPPHTLCAGLADVCGDIVAFAAISAKRFDGWLPSEFAVGTAEADPDIPATAPVAVKVTFADGSTVVRSGVARDFPIALLSPLLTYPSPDAVRMELFFERSSLTVDLRPDPSGRYSYWLSPTGAPVSLTRDRPAFILPSGSPRGVPLPGCVAVAPVATPLAPVVMTQIDGAAPVSLRAAPSTNGGWDAGSARFYLFGADGTQTLCVSASRRRLTARRLDLRPVRKPDAVCRSGDSSLLVLAGEDLVRISGQRVTTLRPFVGADRVGWSPRRREIICFHSQDSPCPDEYLLTRPDSTLPSPLLPDATVLDPKGRLLFTRSCPEVASLLSDGSRLVALDSGGVLYDFDVETAGLTEVAYRTSIPNPSCAASRPIVTLPLIGWFKDGTIEIRADSGGGITRSDLITSLTVRGEIARNPRLQLFIPPRPRLHLTLHLTTHTVTLNT